MAQCCLLEAGYGITLEPVVAPGSSAAIPPKEGSTLG